MGIPHYSTAEDCHPPGKCQYNCQWPLTKHVIDMYREEQRAGLYQYGLYKCYDDEEDVEEEDIDKENVDKEDIVNPFEMLKFARSPCLYFDDLVKFADLTAKNRCDPHFLAWIHVQKPEHFCIQKSVHPDLVSFTEYFFHESIDDEKIRIVTERNTSKTKIQELMNSLISTYASSEHETVMDRLYQLQQLKSLVNSMLTTSTSEM